MKLIKVTRRQAVGKKIMMLQVYTVQVNLLRGDQLEALVVLAVKVPKVAVPVHTVLKAIVHQAHQEAASSSSSSSSEAVVTVDQIVMLTQRKRMRKKSLVVQVRMMTKQQMDNSRHHPMHQFCEINLQKNFKTTVLFLRVS